MRCTYLQKVCSHDYKTIKNHLHLGLNIALKSKKMLAVFSITHAGLFVASRSPVLPDSEPEHDTSYLLYVPG